MRCRFGVCLILFSGGVLWCVGGLRRFLSADFGVMPMWLGIGVVLFPGFGRCGSPV